MSAPSLFLALLVCLAGVGGLVTYAALSTSFDPAGQDIWITYVGGQMGGLAVFLAFLLMKRPLDLLFPK